MKFSEMPYTRIDEKEVMEKLQALIDEAKKAESGEKLWAVHQKKYALLDDILTSEKLASIRNSIDTTDSFYEKEVEFYDNFSPILEQYETEYAKVLFESPHRSYMEQKIGKVAFKNIEIGIRQFSEKNITLMQEENLLITRYEKLIATAKIPFDGETYNLSLMRKFCISPDREVRKRACRAISGYFLSVTDEIDEIYDKMVKNRTAQAKNLGFENYIPLGYLRMQRNSYGQAEVETFRRQVKESFVPFVKKIEEERKKQIGVDALKYYDSGVFFQEGNPAPSGTPEEIMKAGLSMYRELSPETAEFMNFMMENELFDVLGRKTKRAGGYMDYLPKYKAPFIFANFNGTSGDVDVVTHECGHAFQGYLTRNDEIQEHNDLTMETAEIHSMSMEYFTYGWMDKFFGERKDDYLKMHFQDSIIFIPYGCMVDEFQHMIYANPDMTKAQRKETWAKLEKTYRPTLDYDDDPFFSKGGWWQKQGHIFSSPFYYIDYVLASICAMQFKIRMDQDFKGAWADYLKLCRLSVSDFYVPELKAAGLKSPFEEGCIEGIVEEFEKKLS